MQATVTSQVTQKREINSIAQLREYGFYLGNAHTMTFENACRWTSDLDGLMGATPLTVIAYRFMGRLDTLLMPTTQTEWDNILTAATTFMDEGDDAEVFVVNRGLFKIVNVLGDLSWLTILIEYPSEAAA